MYYRVCYCKYLNCQNMKFEEVLNDYRTNSFTEKEKGTRFEVLMLRWLKTDPRYKDQFTKVWMWNDFPGRKDLGGNDTGIDIVAKTEMGEYWAVQCKCYAAHQYIDKPAVDSFLSTSGRTFIDEDSYQTVGFSHRLWLSTTDNWSDNAIKTLQHQTIPISRIGLMDLSMSPVLWEELINGNIGESATVEKKHPKKHQLDAISSALKHYSDHDRGKLIMACGTGKTYTSLLITENLLNHKGGLILFMVPSIALLGQSLNAWCEDAEKPIKAICVCSDRNASKAKKKDNEDQSAIDLAYPATTDVNKICRLIHHYRNEDGLTVIFSTYQSIQAVSDAQKQILKDTNNAYGVFDFIICDEAHRTTGVKAASADDESEFTKIHNNDIVAGRKRMYMTATPRLYGEGAKTKAKLSDCILCSMDEENIYGKEFYHVNFSYAVTHGLLTDYKVLVLTVSEDDIPKDIKTDVEDANNKEINADDTTKLIGVINGLSKLIHGDGGKTWAADPRKMRRAVAFCQQIGNSEKSNSSINMTSTLPLICEKYLNSLPDEKRKQIVNIKTQHIDGSMDSMVRDEKLFWLKEDSVDPNECRILTNVRCLSEGVDVPALDAVIFMSPRNSQVDVVQSVGRVMRNFRKNEEGEKRYGYIIIPVIVPAGVKAEEALQDNARFKVVWDILNALRSHDDHFNAEVNAINLNNDKTSKVLIGGVPQYSGNPNFYKPTQDEQDATVLSNAEVAKQLEIRFGELQNGIYAKLVEKVGDRMYWESWAKEVGAIAQKFIVRIGKAIHERPEHKKIFAEYLKCLQDDINPSVDESQAVEMLAQHIITGPVFDALFSEYKFVENNSVSQSMQRMIDLLKKDAFDKDTDSLEKFYNSVRVNVSKIDNLEGKQTVIKNLYEKFFKGAFPMTVEKLGIVYTPVECVDFIIHSVDDILKKEFDCCLSDENVHILDPFVGTGTFITRILQSGLIRKEDMLRKYQHEIHCCEIVLLSYYIADVNIESVFHDEMHLKEYLPYDGICLTDTFQTAEVREPSFDKKWFGQNSENVEELIKAPVRVIIGNPPYSIGQKSANDNAQNQSYKVVDGRITDTYVAESSAGLNKSTYDAYIKAFRWSSDKLSTNKDGGVIGFISNGAWLDGNAQDGFRKCLQKEFSTIYVLNLRGNQRTSGELSRKEGGKIFGSGSRTPISITFLVKNPNHSGKATIYYHDIGDYLKREDKLKMLTDFRSIKTNKFEWVKLNPDENGDWLNHRNNNFNNLISIEPDKKFNVKAESVFVINGPAIASGRDPWSYNYSTLLLKNSMSNMIDFFNDQKVGFRAQDKITTIENYICQDAKKISWTRSLRNQLDKDANITFDSLNIKEATYRPYCKQNIYFTTPLIESPGISKDLFPSVNYKNLIICISCFSSTKGISVLFANNYADYHYAGDTQIFPLYWYSENKQEERSLFDNPNEQKYIRHDGVSDWILKQVRERYHSKAITKEMIFYYVYGLLHCKEYRETFAVDLKKSLPRIPIPEKAENFISFYQAGKTLADLHLNYETVAPCSDVVVEDTLKSATDDYERFRVAKMKFLSKDRKDTIIYNSHITISNIPAKAYEYVVNGKSAIEWIVERYCVSVDKKSGIKNDANDWGYEHEQPRYIIDLLLSVINVSCQTVDIVNGLPKMNIDENGGVDFISGTWKPTKIETVNLNSDDTPQQLSVPHSSKEHILRLPIKQVYMNQILSGEKKIEYRDLTKESARLYLKMDKQGRLYLNPKNVTEGNDYHIDDFNNGKFPFLLKDIKVLNLHVGNNDNINLEVVNIQAVPNSYDDSEHTTWQIQLHLGQIIK